MAVLDMLELHQFRHSAFCLKVRMVLQAKGLSFRTVEVTPGVGQVAVFRLSGQRQVPVLVDGDQVIADSSAIALHLDQREPDPALIPCRSAPGRPGASAGGLGRHHAGDGGPLLSGAGRGTRPRAAGCSAALTICPTPCVR